MEIRRARPGDEAALRALRLASLESSPDAFASSVEAEAAYPDEHWSKLLDDDSGAVFVAQEGELWLALTGVGVDWEDSEASHIWGMWVHPQARGRGLGARLLDAAIDWARDRPTGRARLWVAETNPGAERLYVSRGFVRTGVTKPHPSDPRTVEIEMELEL